MSVFEMERTWETQTQLVLKTIAAGSRRGRVSGFVQNITAGPVMSGEADVELVTVDPSTAEKAAQLVFDDPPNHIRSQSSPSSPSHDRPSILSTLPQKLDQHHRTETNGVDYLRRRAREGFEMPDPSVRQEEFPFESRIVLDAPLIANVMEETFCLDLNQSWEAIDIKTGHAVLIPKGSHQAIRMLRKSPPDQTEENYLVVAVQGEGGSVLAGLREAYWRQWEGHYIPELRVTIRGNERETTSPPKTTPMTGVYQK